MAYAMLAIIALAILNKASDGAVMDALRAFSNAL